MTDFAISTEGYRGALEPLLRLIEERKMLVSDISLAEVCDAYLAYIERLPAMPMSETAQFVVIASTLLLIKSRSLLPEMEVTEEETQSIAELERRLAAYAQIRAATKLLRARWGNESLYGMRQVPSRPTVFAPGTLTLIAMVESLKRILSAIPVPEALSERTVAPILALEDVIKDVRSRITSVLRTRFSDLTRHTKDRHEVIVYFLAVLELVRSGSASVVQEQLFSDITIEAENRQGVPRYT